MDEGKPPERWTIEEIKRAVSWWQNMPAEEIQNIVVVIQPVPEVQERIGLPVIHTYSSAESVIWLLGQIIGAAGGGVIIDPTSIPREQEWLPEDFQ